MDTNEGEIVRLWKGMRDAQIGWMQVADEDVYGKTKPVFLILAMYSPRGILELHSMRHGRRISISNVGPGFRLIQSSPGMLGSMYCTLAEPDTVGPLVTCFLLSPQGAMSRITLSYSKIAGMVSNQGDMALVKTVMAKLGDASLDQEQRTATFDKLKGVFKNMPEDKDRMDALLLLADPMPILVYLSIIQETFKSSVQQLPLTESLHGISSQSRVQQQTQESKVITDLSVRTHLLYQYQRLQQVLSEPPNGAFQATARQGELEQILKEAFSSFKKHKFESYIKSFALMESEMPCLFSQAFVFDRKWKLGALQTSPLKLADDIDMTRLDRLANILIPPFLFNTYDFQDFKSRLLIGNADWAVLAVRFFKNNSYDALFGDHSDGRQVLASSRLIELLVGGNGLINRRAAAIMLDLANSTTDLRYAVMISTIVRFAVNQLAAANEDSKEIISSLQVLEYHLKQLVTLYEVTECISLPFTINELNKTEKTSLPRLMSIELRKLSGCVSEQWSLIDKMASKTNIQFNRDTVVCYVVFDYIEQWDRDEHYNSLQNAVEFALTISDPKFHEAVLLTIFMHAFNDVLASIIDMIEKNRHVPKQQMCERMCGMAPSQVAQYLPTCIQVLEGLDVPTQFTLIELTNAVIDRFVTDMNGVSVGRENADDALGFVLAILQKTGAHSSQPVSSASIRRHLLMANILLMIFTYDVKMVRPLKMFADNVKFGEGLFNKTRKSSHLDSVPEDDDVAQEGFAHSDPKISAERISFVAKIAESDRMQSKLMANAFGLQGLRIGG